MMQLSFPPNWISSTLTGLALLTSLIKPSVAQDTSGLYVYDDFAETIQLGNVFDLRSLLDEIYGLERVTGHKFLNNGEILCIVSSFWSEIHYFKVNRDSITGKITSFTADTEERGIIDIQDPSGNITSSWRQLISEEFGFRENIDLGFTTGPGGYDYITMTTGRLGLAEWTTDVYSRPQLNFVYFMDLSAVFPEELRGIEFSNIVSDTNTAETGFGMMFATEYGDSRLFQVPLIENADGFYDVDESNVRIICDLGFDETGDLRLIKSGPYQNNYLVMDPNGKDSIQMLMIDESTGYPEGVDPTALSLYDPNSAQTSTACPLVDFFQLSSGHEPEGGVFDEVTGDFYFIPSEKDAAYLFQIEGFDATKSPSSSPTLSQEPSATPSLSTSDLYFGDAFMDTYQLGDVVDLRALVRSAGGVTDFGTVNGHKWLDDGNTFCVVDGRNGRSDAGTRIARIFCFGVERNGTTNEVTGFTYDGQGPINIQDIDGSIKDGFESPDRMYTGFTPGPGGFDYISLDLDEDGYAIGLGKWTTGDDGRPQLNIVHHMSVAEPSREQEGVTVEGIFGIAFSDIVEDTHTAESGYGMMFASGYYEMLEIPLVKTSEGFYDIDYDNLRFLCDFSYKLEESGDLRLITSGLHASNYLMMDTDNDSIQMVGIDPQTGYPVGVDDSTRIIFDPANYPSTPECPLVDFFHQSDAGVKDFQGGVFDHISGDFFFTTEDSDSAHLFHIKGFDATLSPTISQPPSETPSSTPTAGPTLSSSPSSTPSVEPSLTPSSNPTVSNQPSLVPSSSPTVSIEPSLPPSSNPTLSNQPSSVPSSKTSSSPTSWPTPSLPKYSNFIVSNKGNGGCSYDMSHDGNSLSFANMAGSSEEGTVKNQCRKRDAGKCIKRRWTCIFNNMPPEAPDEYYSVQECANRDNRVNEFKWGRLEVDSATNTATLICVACDPAYSDQC